MIASGIESGGTATAAEVGDQGRTWIVDFIRGVGEVTVMRGRYIDISASSCLISRHRLL